MLFQKLVTYLRWKRNV